MGIRMVAGLEPSGYWHEVCALATDLLDVSPLREWRVIVEPAAQRSTAERFNRIQWHCEADRAAKELTVTVPPDSHDSDEGEPEDVASYIVFDLLYDTAFAADGGLGDTQPDGFAP